MEPLIAELKEGRAKCKFGEPIHKLFVKLKFSDFKTTTKEKIGRDVDLCEYIPLLEGAFVRSSLAVRLIGVGVRFERFGDRGSRQLELFA